MRSVTAFYSCRGTVNSNFKIRMYTALAISGRRHCTCSFILQFPSVHFNIYSKVGKGSSKVLQTVILSTCLVWERWAGQLGSVKLIQQLVSQRAQVIIPQLDIFTSLSSFLFSLSHLDEPERGPRLSILEIMVLKPQIPGKERLEKVGVVLSGAGGLPINVNCIRPCVDGPRQGFAHIRRIEEISVRVVLFEGWIVELAVGCCPIVGRLRTVPGHGGVQKGRFIASTGRVGDGDFRKFANGSWFALAAHCCFQDGSWSWREEWKREWRKWWRTEQTNKQKVIYRLCERRAFCSHAAI